MLASAFGRACNNKDEVKIIAYPTGELFNTENQNIVAEMIMKARKEVMFRKDMSPQVKTE